MGRCGRNTKSREEKRIKKKQRSMEGKGREDKREETRRKEKKGGKRRGRKQEKGRLERKGREREGEMLSKGVINRGNEAEGCWSGGGRVCKCWQGAQLLLIEREGRRKVGTRGNVSVCVGGKG